MNRSVLLTLLILLHASVASADFKIAVIGDTQFGHGLYSTGGSVIGTASHNVNTTLTDRAVADELVILDAVLPELYAWNPDVIVLPGDLVNSGIETNAQQRAILASFLDKLESERPDIKVITAWGNHDVATDTCDEQIWGDPLQDAVERTGAHTGRADTFWTYTAGDTRCTSGAGTKMCDGYAAFAMGGGKKTCFVVLPPYFAGNEGHFDGSADASTTGNVSATATTLTDDGLNISVIPAFKDGSITITGGTGSPQTVTITGSTANTFTVAAWTGGTPDSTSTYTAHASGPDGITTGDCTLCGYNVDDPLAVDGIGAGEGKCVSTSAARAGLECQDDIGSNGCGGTIGGCEFCDSCECIQEDAITDSENWFDTWEAEIDTALTAEACDHEWIIAHHQIYPNLYTSTAGGQVSLAGPYDSITFDYRRRVGEMMCARSKMRGAINGHVATNISFDGYWVRNDSDSTGCTNDTWAIYSSRGPTAGYRGDLKQRTGGIGGANTTGYAESSWVKYTVADDGTVTSELVWAQPYGKSFFGGVTMQNMSSE